MYKVLEAATIIAMVDKELQRVDQGGNGHGLLLPHGDRPLLAASRFSRTAKPVLYRQVPHVPRRVRVPPTALQY